MEANPNTTAPEAEQTDPLTSAYAAYLTPASKQKGDAGIYAAMDAMQLARALHGVTDSRLEQSLQPGQQQTITAAGGGVAGARANGASGGPGSHATVQLGVEPAAYRHDASTVVQAIVSAEVVEALQAAAGDGAMPVSAVKAAVQRGMGGASSSSSSASTAVGVPADVHALEHVLPLVREVKPRDPLSYDGLQRLFALMEAAALPASSDGGVRGGGVTALLLANGIVDPAKQPAPSTEAWEAKFNEVQARFPLPTAPAGSADHEEVDDNEGGEEEEEVVDRQHNAALQERCATLQLPYTNYKQAVRDVASYEMRVFPLLCRYLSHNDTCVDRGGNARDVDGGVRVSAHSAARHAACANVKVLNLAGSNLGAPSVPQRLEDEDSSGGGAGGAPVRQLAPLRALAAMLDANESLRYLNLRRNALGPRGVGIVAKALTKNIALTGIDLSGNGLGSGAGGAAGAEEGAAEAEEVEDPLFEEEDAAFGEPLEGLDALAEVLKKNKFLRVLRLAENGLHAGEDLTGPPPPEEVEEEGGEADTAGSHDGTTPARKLLSYAAAQERWQGVPLWTLLTPLFKYHRLRVLDLSKNLLGNTGALMVAVAVAGNHSIEVLDLTDNAIGFSGLAHLATYILGGPQSQQQQHSCAVHTLILRQNPFSCVGGAADAASGVDAHRRRLTKRQQQQCTAAMKTFAFALQCHDRLRRLLLANTYLGPAASAIVLEAVARLSSLEEFDFSFNNACGEHVATYDAAAVPHIAALLCPPSPSRLSRLCLDGNNLTAAGLAAALDSGAPFSPALRELTLSRNSLGDALTPLAAALGSGLTHVDLSYNDITTMVALVDDLPHAAALTEVNLSHNKLGVQEGLLRELPAARQEEEVNALFGSLARLPRLAVVDLSYNDWRPAHVEQLGALLADPSTAPCLRKLDVRHTPRVQAGPLMRLLQAVVGSRPAMEVFLASVPVEKAEDGVENEEVRWTFAAVVQAIYAVVAGSDSLVEVDCGLRLRDAAAIMGKGGRGDGEEEEEEAQTTQDQIAQIQERLLLNALMTAARDGA